MFGASPHDPPRGTLRGVPALCTAAALSVCAGFGACAEPHYDDPTNAPSDAMIVAAGDASSRDAAGGRRDTGMPSAHDTGDATGLTAQSDAATPEPDAGMTLVPAGPLPDWAMPLIGRYAFRVHSVTRDTLNIVSSGDDLWLGEIVREDTGLVLRSETCQAIVSSDVLQVQLEEPSSLERLQRRVILGDHVWSTDGETRFNGYTPEVPADCIGTPGKLIMRRGWQTWLTSPNCVCPASADQKPSIDDCRVTDPDDDKRAGLTLDLRGQIARLPGVLDARAHVVMRSRTHFIAGVVDEGGAHSATLVLDSDIQQLSCEPTGCGNIDSVQTTCHDQPQLVNLARLSASTPTGGAWDCAAVRIHATTLFPVPTPAIPEACKQ